MSLISGYCLLLCKYVASPASTSPKTSDVADMRTPVLLSTGNKFLEFSLIKANMFLFISLSFSIKEITFCKSGSSNTGFTFSNMFLISSLVYTPFLDISKKCLASSTATGLTSAEDAPKSTCEDLLI